MEIGRCDVQEEVLHQVKDNCECLCRGIICAVGQEKCSTKSDASLM